ncbi:TetR family transcriptional regulator [Nonomuraea insulae]|uniref:TetR family transcriptional regulator n=1 Tax=Nonomuraea insulae TaxID=1616787 RepID=A0ABW1DBI4_9ACTN
MQRRARSQDAKLRRAEDLLEAARTLAAERGGVRHITLAAVTEVVGLHPSAVRRYFDNKEELLLELAERGWQEWRDAFTTHLAGAKDLTPTQTATALGVTVARLPLFCDLLTHVPLSLEGEVTIDRARRFESNSFTAFDTMIDTMTATGTMTTEQAEDLLAAAVCLIAHLWQVSHPTPALTRLFDEEPHWGRMALHFEPRIIHFLQATATGLTMLTGRPALAP